jgi:hypothetical protein
MGHWWQQGHAGAPAGTFLWVVRLTSWIVAYALSSALGVLATILLDIRLTGRQGTSRK